MTYVLYHDDTDGIVAAWAASKKYPSATYLPITYGATFPLERKLKKDDIVYLLDFSYPKEFIEKQRKKCSKFIVIDHHKTASHLKDMEDTVFDITKSGAMLAWEFFNPEMPIPNLVKYAQDYDLWLLSLPNCKAVQNLILLCGYDFVQLNTLSQSMESELSLLYSYGQMIERYKSFCIDNIIKGANFYKVDGYKVAMCNAAYPIISQTGNDLLTKYPSIDFSLTFYVKNFSTFIFSLRSKGEMDVGEFAKKYGGGGHKNSAGMILQMTPFEGRFIGNNRNTMRLHDWSYE
jgi:uncharacterized protein